MSNDKTNAERDRREGREDRAEVLLVRLDTAEAPYLDGALDNALFGVPQAIRLLRNHRASAAQLGRLAAMERLVRRREVRLGLATHPSTPRPLALEMLARLGWADLVETASWPRTPAPVRRRAEELAVERVESLSLGELISLARRAPRGLFPALRRHQHPRVVEAMLANPRMTEGDVLATIRPAEASPALLSAVVQSPRWKGFPSIRGRAARHRNTPAADALRCLLGLPRPDLQRIAEDPSTPALVRRAAERGLLEKGGGV